MMLFAAGSRQFGLGGGGYLPLPEEGVLDALGVRDADALVDGKRLPQVRGGLVAVVAVVEVAVADIFQGTRFLKRHADVAGYGERLAVMAAGTASVIGPGSEPAQVVVCLGHAEAVAEVTAPLQALLEAGGS